MLWLHDTQHLTITRHRIHLSDIVKVQRSHDPSLPSGGGIWILLSCAEDGIYLVAANSEEADCWVDAILLCAFLVEQRRERALGSALRASVHE